MDADTIDRESQLDALCAEYLRAAEAGTPPGRAAWLAQHSAFAAELADFLDTLNEVRRRVAPLRVVAGGEETIGYSAAESDPVGSSAVPAPRGYVILGPPIGIGGMGVVYRARDVELSRVVALKMIRVGELSGESAVQRFRLEAEAAAGFDHPHIVPVYEVGVTEAGDPFFSMKLVEGQTLSDWVVSGWGSGGALRTAAGLRSGIELLAKVVRAVHYAHQRGFLHRDLKPANVLLDEAGVPYVTDFGLAKRLTDAAEGQSLTQAGGLVGTLGYMAPEQARGEKGLTTAVDVYALGAILFHVLTGRPLRPGRTLPEVSAHIGRAAPLPRSVNPRTDRYLEAICLKCLANEPADRFGSAEALADDLDRWCRGRPTRTLPPRPVQRLWMWARRRPDVAALSALTLVVFLTGVGLVTWMWREAETAREQEVTAKREAQGQASRSAAVVAGGLLEEGADGDPENLGAAMLWWARSFRLAPESDAREQSAARANLAALFGRLHTLRELWERPATTSRLALAPDGRRAAVAEVNAVRLFDPQTGREAEPALAHPGVTLVAFSPDGAAIATAGNGVVRVWDLRPSPPIQTLELEIAARTVAVGPGGRLLAIVADKPRVSLFEYGKPVGEPLEHPHRVDALAFDAAGARLATGAADKFARVWDPGTGKLIGNPMLHDDGIRTIAFAPNGSKLITGCDDHGARVWALGTTAPPLRLEHQDYVRAVAFSSDGRLVATGGSDFAAQVWEADTGRRVGQLLRHGGGVEAVGFVVNGTELITSSSDRVVRVWELSAATRDERSVALGAPVFSVVAASDGPRVYAGTARGLYQLDAMTLRVPRNSALLAVAGGLVSAAPEPEAWAVTYAPGTGWVAAGGRTTSESGWVRVCRTDGTEARTFAFDQPVRSLSFAPNGSRLLMCTADPHAGGLWAWDAADPHVAPRALPDAGHGPVWVVTHSPDGSRYATSAGYGEVRVWRSDTDRAERDPLPQPWRVVALAFHRDGNRLVTASTDQQVRFWDAGTGALLTESSVHRGAIWAVAVSPDGRLVATAGRDRCVRVWDAGTGAPVGAPLHHRATVWAVTFSADGKEIWTGSEDGIVRAGAGGAVRRWRTPNTTIDVPDAHVATWVEVVTGQWLDGDRVRVLGPLEWRERRERLIAAGVKRQID